MAVADTGLGGYIVEFTQESGSAKFKFRDPEDVNNTAEVAISEKDFPEGITTPDDRRIADMAYAQCSKLLNDKRDARINKKASDDLANKQKEDARVREAAVDHFANSNDVAVQPVKTESDGTKVYNTEALAEDSKDSKKK